MNKKIKCRSNEIQIVGKDLKLFPLSNKKCDMIAMNELCCVGNTKVGIRLCSEHLNELYHITKKLKQSIRRNDTKPNHISGHI